MLATVQTALESFGRGRIGRSEINLGGAMRAVKIVAENQIVLLLQCQAGVRLHKFPELEVRCDSAVPDCPPAAPPCQHPVNQRHTDPDKNPNQAGLLHGHPPQPDNPHPRRNAHQTSRNQCGKLENLVELELFVEFEDGFVIRCVGGSKMFRIMVITLSDRASAGEYEDRSGLRIRELVRNFSVH